MTNLQKAREAIYQRFVNQKPAAIGNNFCFANEKYDPPADTLWARLTVVHDTGVQDSLGKPGDRKFLRRGRVFIQIYDTVDSGLLTLDTVAAAVRDIFEGTSFNSLYFTNADIRETGPDGEWFQVVVDAPFDYQQTK